MRYLGDVDIRPVDPGENLDEYDLTVVTLTNARVQGNNDLYGALWTVVQDWTGGPRCVVNFDHWTLRDCVKSYTRFARDREQMDKLWDGFIEYKRRDKAILYKDLIEEQLRRFAEAQWPLIATCAWDWGDHRLLTRGLEDTGFPEEFSLLYDP